MAKQQIDYRAMLEQKIAAHERLEALYHKLIGINEDQRQRLIQLTMANDNLRWEVARLRDLEKQFTDELKGNPQAFSPKRVIKDDTNRPYEPAKSVGICLSKNSHNFQNGKCVDCAANQVMVGVQSQGEKP